MELDWGGTAAVGEAAAARGAAALCFSVDSAAVELGRGGAVVEVGLAVGSAIGSSAAQRAARAEMLDVGEAALLTGYAAGELSVRVLLLVLTGAGGGGGSASSQARFAQDRVGGVGIEAALA